MRNFFTVAFALTLVLTFTACDTTPDIAYCTDEGECENGSTCTPIVGIAESVCVDIGRVCLLGDSCLNGYCVALEGVEEHYCAVPPKEPTCWFAQFNKRYSVEDVNHVTVLIDTDVDLKSCTMQFFDVANPTGAQWRYVFTIDEGEQRVVAYSVYVQDFVEILTFVPNHISIYQPTAFKGGGGGDILDFIAVPN